MKFIRIVFAAGLIFYSPQANAQYNFNASSIPDSLKRNANAVYVLDEGILEVKAPGVYTLQTHQIITVLNREGLAHLTQSFFTDKFNSVEEVQIKIYDSIGNEIKKYKKKDFITQAYADESTLLSDNKILYLQAFSPSLPCTIEIKSEEHATSCIDLPDWTINSPNESVLKTIFTVKTQENFDIRYTIQNIKLPSPIISKEGNSKVYRWEIGNTKARKYELNSYEANRYLPKIQIAPQAFQYDGYKGSFTNWRDFGAWNYNLYEEPTPFNQERINQVLELVKNDSSEKEKIKTLYKYLQNKTRYVSIQLGIGGFKPFSVNFVDTKKYGDCKALTNYMRYLLKVSGIKAYPALINAGYNKSPADINFPTQIFNHVILCVPLKKDTIWLECTSKTNECGILGSFTENKKALLLTEDGGILINTPLSNYRNNSVISKSIVNVDEDGGAVANTTFFYKGEFTGIFEQLQQKKADEKKLWLSENLYFKNPDELQVNDFNTVKSSFTASTGYEQLFNFKTGSKYFFQSKILKFAEDFQDQNESRVSPYIFNYPYKKTDTTIYNLGKNFVAEPVPVKKIIENEYAVYEQECNYNSTDNTITTITTFILKHNIVPAKNYKELVTFFNEMNKIENNKVIVKRL